MNHKITPELQPIVDKFDKITDTKFLDQQDMNELDTLFLDLEQKLSLKLKSSLRSLNDDSLEVVFSKIVATVLSGVERELDSLITSQGPAVSESPNHSEFYANQKEPIYKNLLILNEFILFLNENNNTDIIRNLFHLEGSLDDHVANILFDETKPMKNPGRIDFDFLCEKTVKYLSLLIKSIKNIKELDTQNHNMNHNSQIPFSSILSIMDRENVFETRNTVLAFIKAIKNEISFIITKKDDLETYIVSIEESLGNITESEEYESKISLLNDAIRKFENLKNIQKLKKAEKKIKDLQWNLDR